MTEAEVQVAGLETGSLAASNYPEIGAWRNGSFNRFPQSVVTLGMAIVEQLNFESIARPVELCCRADHANRKSALIANGKLNQYARKRAVRQIHHRYVSPGAEPAQERQPEQLKRQECQEDEDTGQSGLKEQGKTGHEVLFGPPSPLLSTPSPIGGGGTTTPDQM